jgi:Flp pilus assembly pilin Flp
MAYLTSHESRPGDRRVAIPEALASKSIHSTQRLIPRGPLVQFCLHIWSDERGQDIAEYAVMLAVILILVIGTVRLIGGNANNAFSAVASNLGQ